MRQPLRTALSDVQPGEALLVAGLAGYLALLALGAAGLLGPAPGVWSFLPLALPIALWVAWNDMARMKIPNLAVLALGASFLLIGPFALPLDVFALRLVQGLGVLVLGFVLNMVRAIGAGDAKFAAAMAPFFDPADTGIVLRLFAAILLAAYVTHRLARAVPAIRRRTPDWESWARRDFPMGLALGGLLALYLVLAALSGR